MPSCWFKIKRFLQAFFFFFLWVVNFSGQSLAIVYVLLNLDAFIYSQCHVVALYTWIVMGTSISMLFTIFSNMIFFVARGDDKDPFLTIVGLAVCACLCYSGYAFGTDSFLCRSETYPFWYFPVGLLGADLVYCFLNARFGFSYSNARRKDNYNRRDAVDKDPSQIITVPRMAE